MFSSTQSGGGIRSRASHILHDPIIIMDGEAKTAKTESERKRLEEERKRAVEEMLRQAREAIRECNHLLMMEEEEEEAPAA